MGLSAQAIARLRSAQSLIGHHTAVYPSLHLHDTCTCPSGCGCGRENTLCDLRGRPEDGVQEAVHCHG